jgi:hypothetical protein
MSISHKGPSIDASYQVSIHLAKRFQRTRFLEIDQLETRIVYGSHIWESPLLRLLISSRSVNKHGRHKQLLFLIGRFVTIFFSETAWPNVPKNDMKHQWNKMSIL